MNNRRLLVTGGSGFIGSNVVHYYRNIGWDVINISRSQPLANQHRECWRQCYVEDYARLKAIILDFNPEYIIHLAGRTDMKEGNINDYQVNVDGVKNILAIAEQCKKLNKIIFTSSSLASNPISAYGESKAYGEKIVKMHPPQCDWSIIRPTAIWGPGFHNSYYAFFNTLCKGRYFHINHIDSKKTFGYVENTVYQIDRILRVDTKDIEDKVFYLGDYEPYNIREWAEEIALMIEMTIPKMPFWFAKSGAVIGDILNMFNIEFPLTTTRINNMMKDNVVSLEKTKAIVPDLPFSRLDGVKKTLKWMGQTS